MKIIQILGDGGMEFLPSGPTIEQKIDDTVGVAKYLVRARLGLVNGGIKLVQRGWLYDQV